MIVKHKTMKNIGIVAAGHAFSCHVYAHDLIGGKPEITVNFSTVFNDHRFRLTPENARLIARALIEHADAVEAAEVEEIAA